MNNSLLGFSWADKEIQKAYEFAKERHKGQFRETGEEYIEHPVAAARILFEKGFGTDYIIAELFHDLIEDTGTTYQEILERSNIRVADAVFAVTKPKDYEISKYIEKIRENEIARIVKLADKIHNIRTAGNTSKVRKIIIETQAFYLDLAKGTVFEHEIVRDLEELKKNEILRFEKMHNAKDAGLINRFII